MMFEFEFVCKKQTAIGLKNLLKGSISSSWHTYIATHIRAKRLNTEAEEWAPKFVISLWDHTLRMWQYHINAFHASNDTNIKWYKLEALTRKNALCKK
jgi:hypothetical protein